MIQTECNYYFFITRWYKKQTIYYNDAYIYMYLILMTWIIANTQLHIK